MHLPLSHILSTTIMSTQCEFQLSYLNLPLRQLGVFQKGRIFHFRGILLSVSPGHSGLILLSSLGVCVSKC